MAQRYNKGPLIVLVEGALMLLNRYDPILLIRRSIPAAA
jgi:hypothetical protein